MSLTHRERATDAERSYDGSYPSLHLTYSLSDNLIVRAAYAKTYGRPDFTDILPNAQVDEADLDGDQVGNPAVVQGNITVTNPGLLPWSADNYDLSLEYQFSKGLSLYLSASDVFNAAKVTQRYGSETPDYAKRYLTDHKGVSLSLGLKGTF